MKPTFCLLLLAASLAWADEASERGAIDKVIAALNTQMPDRGLFTADFSDSAELAEFAVQDGAGHVVISHEPLGEATFDLGLPSRFVIRSVRFVTADVALANGIGQHKADASPPGRVPVLFVMKKEGPDWRIASLRTTSR